jgi:hypothetical protein
MLSFYGLLNYQVPAFENISMKRLISPVWMYSREKTDKWIYLKIFLPGAGGSCL